MDLLELSRPIGGEKVKPELSSSLLVIIMDTNPSQLVIRNNSQFLTQYVDSLVAFGNAHLMQKTDNQLAVMSCHHHASEFLYPMPGTQLEITQTDGQFEEFALVEKTIKNRLSALFTNAPVLTAPCESMLAGAIAKALTYIQKIKRQTPKDAKLYSRILVTTGSSDCTSQYMAYQNVFFSAQKLGIVIDVCSFAKPLSLLQQGCDITGGQYLCLPNMDGLLVCLLWVFLPDPQIRDRLVTLPPVKVDYRAACFCHRELIEIGYVCSVCLSIFCKFSPICTTCHAVFKVPAQMFKPKKKKKA